MSKEILLRTLSVAALAAALAPAAAHAKPKPATTINGGGATQEHACLHPENRSVVAITVS